MAFHWYKEYGEHNATQSDVVVHVVQYNKKTQEFAQRPVDATRLHFIRNDRLFPMGMYQVVDPRSTSVTFVFPKCKQDGAGHKAVLADSYTFEYDERDAMTPFHVGLSLYVPSYFDVGVAHRDEVVVRLPEDFHLGTDNSHFERFLEYNHTALDLCCIPFKERARYDLIGTQDSKKKNATTSTVTARTSRLLNGMGVRRIMLVCVKNEDGGWSVTTRMDRSGPDFVFQVKEPVWRTVQHALCDVIDAR